MVPCVTEEKKISIVNFERKKIIIQKEKLQNCVIEEEKSGARGQTASTRCCTNCGVACDVSWPMWRGAARRWWCAVRRRVLCAWRWRAAACRARRRGATLSARWTRCSCCVPAAVWSDAPPVTPRCSPAVRLRDVWRRPRHSVRCDCTWLHGGAVHLHNPLHTNRHNTKCVV